ncbi:MAG: hypothetical protein ACPHGV_09800, partial [Synechococcus sp.]
MTAAMSGEESLDQEEHNQLHLSASQRHRGLVQSLDHVLRRQSKRSRLRGLTTASQFLFMAEAITSMAEIETP